MKEQTEKWIFYGILIIINVFLWNHLIKNYDQSIVIAAAIPTGYFMLRKWFRNERPSS